MHVPKIQEMLDKIPTPLSGATCNEKTGWLPPNFDDNCREILTDTINEILELQPADFDLDSIASTSNAINSELTTKPATNEEGDWEYAEDEEAYEEEDRDQSIIDFEEEEDV